MDTLKLAYAKLREKKYLLQSLVFLFVFYLLYSLIDYLNMPYPEMVSTYGIYLVIINLGLNGLMAFLSAILMSLSAIMAELKGKEGNGSTLGFISVFFGMLTYGCTSCVIAFFAGIGIAFSVIALPLAGLPYKLISLLLVLLGLVWVSLEIKNGKCRVKRKPKQSIPPSEDQAIQ